MSASYNWDEISAELSEYLNLHPQDIFQYSTSLSGRKIRLIQLKPGSRTETIYFSFVEKYLDENVSYNCVSYVWGDSTNRPPIQCSGERFMISHNLYEFLW